MREKFFRWATAVFTLNNPVLYAGLYCLFLVKAYTCLDPDFGWHIMSGAYIVTHGVPRHDLYSYTATQFPWINHEWFTDVINYGIFHFLGGYTVLAIVYAFLWTFALWIVGHQTRHRFIVLLAGLAILPFSGVRTITWTALFFAVLIRVMASANRRWSHSWLPPLIILVWANMHGSFVLGVGYVWWYFLWNHQNRRRAIITTVLATLASLANPYGIGLYVEVFRTMSDPTLHSRINEWRSFNLSIGAGLIVGLWFGFSLMRRIPVWKRIVNFELILLIMALSSERHTVPLMIYSIPGIATMMSKAPVTRSIWREPIVQRITIVLALLGVIIAGTMITTTFEGVTLNRENNYPAHIAASLRASPCRGNVFNNYNYGGYLIWRVPGEKVYIDGRMPSWSMNGVNYMNNYEHIINSAAYQKQQFSLYNIQCVVWNNHTSFVKRLVSQGWRIVQREPTNTIVLLER